MKKVFVYIIICMFLSSNICCSSVDRNKNNSKNINKFSALTNKLINDTISGNVGCKNNIYYTAVLSDDIDCDLYLFCNGLYKIVIVNYLTDDIISEEIISIGKYKETNDSLIFFDKSSRKFRFYKKCDNTLEGVLFSLKKITFKMDGDCKQEFIQNDFAEINFCRSSKDTIKNCKDEIIGRWDFGCDNFYLNVFSNGNYKYMIGDIVLSEGKYCFDKNTKKLTLKDNMSGEEFILEKKGNLMKNISLPLYQYIK